MLTNPALATRVLERATSGRPVVVSKGIAGDLLVQCSGTFFNDPADEGQTKLIEQTLNDLVEDGLLWAGQWRSGNLHLVISDVGRELFESLSAIR